MPSATAIVRKVDYAAAGCMRRHAHEYHNISLVLRGEIEETAGRTTVSASAASVVIKPAGLEHSNRVGPRGCRTLTLQFPISANTRVHYGWHFGGPVVRAATELFESLLGRVSLDERHVDLSLSDLLAAAESCRNGEGRTLHKTIALRAREMLQDSYQQPVSSRHLAAELGVHPVYLARAFRAQFATTMSRYIRHLRARRAAELLAETSVPAAPIAIELGFADQAHFCRAFREEFGVSPGAFRRLVAA